jgi:hypothetical protein
MKSLEPSGVEGQLDKYRRTPGPVELEDGGGAVMAATEVDDGVNDGPDPSVLVDHVATADLRDVDRFETHAKGKRAERCEEGHSKHSPGAGVEQLGIGEASPGTDVALRGQSKTARVAVVRCVSVANLSPTASASGALLSSKNRRKFRLRHTPSCMPINPAWRALARRPDRS